MKRAAVERLRTRSVWLRHLRHHRSDGTALVCACELQMGRFRKGQRVGGCGNSRCWLCQVAQLRLQQAFTEQLAEVFAG